MIALLFSVLLALYLLGPDLVVRWMLGFAAPRKSLILSRSEEIARAVIWALFPLLAALVWAKWAGVMDRFGGERTLHTFLSGVLSDTLFRSDEQAWFRSAASFLKMNLALLWRLYLIVGVAAVALTAVTLNYGAIRRSLPHGRWRTLFARVVLPRIAEWYVLLSDMLLPAKDMVLYADVLTRSGLYQGVIQDKVLGTDGSLRSLTLATPRRFLREQYDSAREQKPGLPSRDFWKEIAGNLFVIPGTEIANLNLRYSAKAPAQIGTPSAEERALLEQVLARLDAKTTGGQT